MCSRRVLEGSIDRWSRPLGVWLGLSLGGGAPGTLRRMSPGAGPRGALSCPEGRPGVWGAGALPVVPVTPREVGLGDSRWTVQACPGPAADGGVFSLRSQERKLRPREGLFFVLCLRCGRGGGLSSPCRGSPGSGRPSQLSLPWTWTCRWLLDQSVLRVWVGAGECPVSWCLEAALEPGNVAVAPGRELLDQLIRLRLRLVKQQWMQGGTGPPGSCTVGLAGLVPHPHPGPPSPGARNRHDNGGAKGPVA